MADVVDEQLPFVDTSMIRVRVVSSSPWLRKICCAVTFPGSRVSTSALAPSKSKSSPSSILSATMAPDRAHGPWLSILIGDDLGDHQGCLLGRAHRNSADRDRRQPIVIEIDKPVIRGGLEGNRVNQLRGHKVKVPQAQVVAGIKTRIPDQQHKPGRPLPVGPCPVEKVSQGLRALCPETELVVKIFDVDQEPPTSPGIP